MSASRVYLLLERSVEELECGNDAADHPGSAEGWSTPPSPQVVLSRSRVLSSLSSPSLYPW